MVPMKITEFPIGHLFIWQVYNLQ